MSETTEAPQAQATDAKKAKKEDQLSVLAFRRLLNPSHFAMFSTSQMNTDPKEHHALSVREEPLRGLNATAKSKEEEKASAVLQVVESAELRAGDDTLVLKGSVAVTPGLNQVQACNQAAFIQRHRELVEQAITAGLISELAIRYAITLASGMWGWRNAVQARSVTVVVRQAKSGKTWSFADLLPSGEATFDLNEACYEGMREALVSLGACIEEALCDGNNLRATIFDVEGYFDMGAGARVYPSQEWPSEVEKQESKRKWGEKSAGVTRVLAKVINAQGLNQAIVNDRKVGNALRTIDTWYGEAAKGAPIAVEPYGANSHQSVAWRATGGKDLFSLVKRVYEPTKNNGLSVEEQLFYLACVIRGGVFGVKD